MTLRKWRKSSWSGADGGDCVEIDVSSLAAVKDSKNPNQDTMLNFKGRGLDVFLRMCKELSS